MHDRYASARRALILAVERGELHPEAAEDRAREQGLKPLLPERDCTGAPPPRWTATMALAWLTFRTPAAVLRFSKDGVAQLRNWMPHGEITRGANGRARPAGFHLEPTNLTPLELLELQAASAHTEGDAMAMTFAAAAAELRAECLRGDLVASAVVPNGTFVNVPPGAWALRVDSVGGHDALCHLGGYPAYQQLNFDARAVQRRWRTPSSLPAGPDLQEVIREIAIAIPDIHSISAKHRDELIVAGVRARLRRSVSKTKIKDALAGTGSLKKRARRGAIAT